MEIKICKDVREYRESVFMGLTMRQVLCSIGAIGVAAGLFLGFDSVLGRQMASWICIIGAFPIAIAGFFNYNGLTIERFIKVWIKTNFINCGVRLWQGENLYYKIWRDIIDKDTQKLSVIGKVAQRFKVKNNARQYTDKEST